MHGEWVRVIGGLDRRVTGERTSPNLVRQREARDRSGKHRRELALPRGDDRVDRGGGKNEKIGQPPGRIREDVAQSDETTHRMPVEHHRESGRSRAHLGEPILDVVVVLRPAIDVRALTTRSTEAALIVGVRRDPRARELRRDVRVAARVFRDAVDEEEVRACGAHRGPPIGAEIEAVPCANEGHRLRAQWHCHVNDAASKSRATRSVDLIIQ